MFLSNFWMGRGLDGAGVKPRNSSKPVMVVQVGGLRLKEGVVVGCRSTAGRSC